MTTVTSYQPNNCTNINTFDDFTTCANQSGGSYLFTAIDFLVTTVIFLTLAGPFGWEAAIMSAGFIGIILSLLFAYMGVMAWSVTGIYVGGLIVMIAYVIWSNRYD